MREIRVHLGTGSCYLILVSPVKLKADGLKRCLEDFVKERRCSSFAWAFAQSVEAVPAYAGFQKLVHLVEDLRSEMQIPFLGTRRLDDSTTLLGSVFVSTNQQTHPK